MSANLVHGQIQVFGQVFDLFVFQLVLLLEGMQILFNLSDAWGIGKNTPTQHPSNDTKSFHCNKILMEGWIDFAHGY